MSENFTHPAGEILKYEPIDINKEKMLFYYEKKRTNGDKLKTDNNKTDLEEIQILFDPKIGHFADKSARWLFKKSENLHGLVLMLSSELAEHLDFTKTKIENRSYVDDTLRDVVSDMVFTVPYRDDTLTDNLTVYILIEHQSTVDHLMGFRLLSYMCQIWHAQLESQKNAKVPVTSWRLRPILPIVFYTGDKQWKLPISLSASMDVPELMAPFVPTYTPLLFGVKVADIAKFTEVDHPFANLMMVLRQEKADATSMHQVLETALTHLDTLASENPELHKHALLYLYYLVLFRRPNEEQKPLRHLLQTHTHNKEVENIIMTGAEALIQKGKNQGLQEGIEQGIEQGKAKGLQQGEIQTKREILLKLLDIRIGDVPETISRKVSRMRSRSRLDALLEQVATAQSLDDIKWK